MAQRDTGAQEIDTVYLIADTAVFRADTALPPGWVRFDERPVFTVIDAGNRSFEAAQIYGGIARRAAAPDSIRAEHGYSLGGQGQLRADTLVIVSDDDSWRPGHTWKFVRR